MLEGLVRSQLPPGCRLERLDRAKSVVLDRLLAEVEHRLGREFQIFVTNDAVAETFALCDGANDAVVFAHDQALQAAFCRPLFLAEGIFEGDLATPMRGTILRIMAHQALKRRQGDLAAQLLAAAFELTEGLFLPEAINYLAHDQATDEAALSFWHLGTLHELGHLVQIKRPEIEAWVDQSRTAIVREYVTKIRPTQPAIADAFEASFQESHLATERLRDESLADCFAVDTVFRSAATVVGPHISYDQLFADCIAWQSAVNLVQRTSLFMDAWSAPSLLATTNLICQEAAAAVRTNVVCQLATVLLAPPFAKTERPTQANHMATRQYLYEIVDHVRARDAAIERAALRAFAFLDDLSWTSDMVNRFVLRLIACEQDAPLLFATRRFLDAASSVSSGLMDDLRAALRGRVEGGPWKSKPSPA